MTRRKKRSPRRPGVAWSPGTSAAEGEKSAQFSALISQASASSRPFVVGRGHSKTIDERLIRRSA
jgi:hypothetical protein